jgi:phage N-6-adenine-methyltransferase
MINGGIMSSDTDLWATPQWLFDALNSHYEFNLDVCAVPENAKCEKFFSPQEDGLKQKWEGVCWMNPPYGRKILKWVKKAYESSKEGAIVVALLPSRNDTAWFWDYTYWKARIEFIKGRLKFGDGKGSAPFPSLIAVWEPDYPTFNKSDKQLCFNLSCYKIREGCCRAGT